MGAARRGAPHQASPTAPQRLGRVLLVEDEQDVAELIRYNLTKEGYDVVMTANGADALRLARERQPDVVLLDIMVPQLNGWEVCRRLKKDPELSAIPVIMVTVVRRGRQADAKEKKANLKAGDLEIDRYRFEVRMKGRPIELTPKEFDLLATLVGTPGRVFGREELLDIVWGRDGFVEPRTVDVHLARLRGKFTAAKAEEPGIETVRGVGYRFRDSKP